ncbi:hypothetical protein AAZX31_18G115300 [Glycine max]
MCMIFLLSLVQLSMLKLSEQAIKSNCQRNSHVCKWLRVEAVRSVDQKYHVSVKAKSDASATGKSVAAAANTVINIFVYLF